MGKSTLPKKDRCPVCRGRLGPDRVQHEGCCGRVCLWTKQRREGRYHPGPDVVIDFRRAKR